MKNVNSNQNAQAKISINEESNLEPYLYAKTSPIIQKRVVYLWDLYKDGQIVKLSESDNGQCVNFVKYLIGYTNGYSGNAKEWIKYINSEIPSVGSVVVFEKFVNPSQLGHLAVVKEVKRNQIKIIERNYGQLYLVNERWIDINDPMISGYIRI